MKKRLVIFIAAILSLVMSISFLGGCNLVTVDSEKDVKQVIADVNVLVDEGYEGDKIYKYDMVSEYLNYGYYYVYYYGYTQSQTFEMIVDNLVKSRIVLQYSMKYFEDNEGVENTSVEKWNAERYLTDEDGAEELLNAKYQTVKSMNSLIDQYVEAEDEEFADSFYGTDRAIPTSATNKEKDVDKQAYVDAGVIKGVANGTEEERARHKAYNKFIKFLENNNLLGKDFKGDITESDYYKNTLKNQYNSAVILKYEEILETNERKELTFDTLSSKYKDMYDTQRKGYTDNETDFSAAVKNNSASSPLIYSPFSGYGYVYNLLLGASEEQTALIGNIKATEVSARKAERRAILSGTTVTDLRSSWLYKGYDFDLSTNKFTGDYTFTSAENSLPFMGKVELLNPEEQENEDFVPKYKVEKGSVKTFGLDEFIGFMNNYLYGDENIGESVSEGDIYRKAEVPKGTATEYNEKINELLFAFSTDGGSLNTYKGYPISPAPEVDGSETYSYVTEFANAARELIKLGGESYVIVATDYGYHVMFFSEVLNASTDYATLVDYLNSFGETKSEEDWKRDFAEMLDNFEDYEEKDSYLYVLANSILGSSTVVTDAENKLVRDYKYNKKYVNIYESVYADLMK